MSSNAQATVVEQESSLGFFAAIFLIARREIAAYFDSSIAYVYTIAFVVLANSIFMNEFFLTGTVDMTSFFDLLPFLLAFFLPAITMRLWAEEKKQRTIRFSRIKRDIAVTLEEHKFLAWALLICLLPILVLGVVVLTFKFLAERAGVDPARRR